MHVWNITNLQAILILIGIGFLTWLFIRLVPAKHTPAATSFTQKEVRDYDKDTQKYFIVGSIALLISSAHTVIKNIPGLWQWLWRAGYGGHLFRDAANSHLMIMGGGVILLLGITWYLLPRFSNRPIYSKTLANLSLWFITAGVAGTYLSWSILGLLEGGMVVQGWTYEAAKETLGLWHKLPVGIFSGIMGVGFWIYIINVYITVALSRRVQQKPLGFMNKFIVVSASAFLVGSIQGIAQSMSASGEWLENAGVFGEFIDPVSHVHMNILVGMFVALLAMIWFFGYREESSRTDKRNAQILFWGFTPASIAFYGVFLFTGLIVGNARNGYGGLEMPVVAVWLEKNFTVLQFIAGVWLLGGFLVYFGYVITRLYGKQIWTLIRQAKSGAFWLFSVLLLAIGTTQGLLHIIPATRAIFTVPDELSNIHAQLNMVGGVLLALIGVVYQMFPVLTGADVPRTWRRRSLFGISSGILGYYLMSIFSGLIRYSYLRKGMNDAAAATQMNWYVPFLLMVTTFPLFFGAFSFFKGVWAASQAYRQSWFREFRRIPVRYNGPAARYQKHFPMRMFLLVELVFGLFGFPGLGWIFTGQALYGLILMVASPIILWVFIPIFISVYDIHTYLVFGPAPMMIYIVCSSALSVLLLWISLTHPARKIGRGEQN